MTDADIRYLVIRSDDGIVVNVTVGEPPLPEGFETVLQSGDAAVAGIGWIRNTDGTWTDTSASFDPFA